MQSGAAGARVWLGAIRPTGPPRQPGSSQPRQPPAAVVPAAVATAPGLPKRLQMRRLHQ